MNEIEMATDKMTTGIALLCDKQGIVLNILHDDLGVVAYIAPGKPWSAVVDRGSLKKALNFLVELRQQGVVFDWEMNVSHEEGPITLHFVGAELDDYLLIVGAKSSNGVMALYEEMMHISNEQANALRSAAKEHAEQSRDRSERNNELYNEISRLNNDLVAMQRELARKNAELERLNEQKNELLGMAAHDMRNPLHAILAYSEFLIEEASAALSEEHIEFLSIIQSSSEFMAALLNDLLDVAKIESGKLQLSLEPCDLPSLTTQNVARNRILARNKGIEMRPSIEALPPIMLDPAKIEQVLNNLISNAIKYSPPNTSIDVILRRDGERAVLSVQDQGQGIPEHELDALFQPFQTTSAKATGGEASTGLGLVITKKIIEGHGGDIEVDSEVGKGTTFTVTLPLDLGSVNL